MSDLARRLFLESLELDSPEARSDFLDRKCTSIEVRQQVSDLLSAYESEGTFPEAAHELDPTASFRGEDSDADADLTQPPDSSGFEQQLYHQSLGRFGDYELLEKIAQGGMGVVYRARQISLDREVALKMILSSGLAGREEIDRFHIEAKAAARIDHPGIVPIFDVGCCEGKHFYSMGLIDGPSLAEKIKSGSMEPRQAAALVKQIAAAIHVAHANGIVHRDLKPGNVLVDQNGNAKITDFGLAKRVEGDSNLTTTGMVMGTPCYMPPEQAEGMPIDSSADIYSLGAILYALLTGGPPFGGLSQIETLIKVIHEEPVSPRKCAPAIPKDLELICLKCLEKDKANRYTSAIELAADLENFLAGEPIAAKNDLRRRLRKWTVREPVLAAQLALTAAIMLIVGINYLIFGGIGDRLHNLQRLYVYEAILLVSAATAIVLQKVHNRLSNRYVVPIVWAGLNPIFLTLALSVSVEPRSLLYSLYLLLIITICFFRRVDLVVVTTVSSVVGYLALTFTSQDPGYASYRVVFALTLITAGILLGFMALRLKRLSQKEQI